MERNLYCIDFTEYGETYYLATQSQHQLIDSQLEKAIDNENFSWTDFLSIVEENGGTVNSK